MLDGKRDQVFVLSQTGDELQIDQRKMEKAFALCCKLENCIQVRRKQHMVELLDGWSKKLGFTKTKKRGLMKSGNGMHSTIITVSFNVVDGYTTFKSATVGAGKRVKWPGYHVITSANEAMKFTVAELTQGGMAEG
ncbi:hypothetical protein D5086_007866 [Populus alba]|uniref:Uncharacterized protein n=1 Tax=Populus alba TaxID=43335 RepID=A0ACC4CFA6_POPAL